MIKPLIYVAGPYSSTSEHIKNFRGAEHARLTAELIKKGHLAYSPIAETMTLAHYGKMTNTDWESWREKDLRQISVSDEMIVLLLEGWKESVGVRGEVKYCLQNKIPLFFLDPADMIINAWPDSLVLKAFGVKSLNELND